MATRVGSGSACLDGRVDGGDGLGPALGLQDGGLAVALGPQDGGLALTLRGPHRGLRVALGHVDGGLLLAPPTVRMVARFSWSACFWRARACRICGGGAISTISIRLMRMPHLSVTTSICCWTSVLMRSRSDSASSSVIVPITDRSAVRASASMAMSKFFTLNRACRASTTWVKMVALTVTTTLSLVMTSWRSPGTGISRMSTRWSDVDERGDDHQARLVRGAVLAEALEHADLTLLDDVDHLAQGQQQHGHDQEGHDQAHDERMLS